MINSNKVCKFYSVDLNFSFKPEISFTAFWAKDHCDGFLEWYFEVVSRYSRFRNAQWNEAWLRVTLGGRARNYTMYTQILVWFHRRDT